MSPPCLGGRPLGPAMVLVQCQTCGTRDSLSVCNTCAACMRLTYVILAARRHNAAAAHDTGNNAIKLAVVRSAHVRRNSRHACAPATHAYIHASLGHIPAPRRRHTCDGAGAPAARMAWHTCCRRGIATTAAADTLRIPTPLWGRLPQGFPGRCGVATPKDSHAAVGSPPPRIPTPLWGRHPQGFPRCCGVAPRKDHQGRCGGSPPRGSPRPLRGSPPDLTWPPAIRRHRSVGGWGAGVALAARAFRGLGQPRLGAVDRHCFGGCTWSCCSALAYIVMALYSYGPI